MLKFRPHHFLCTLGFEGKGYSAEFIRNYAQIVDRLRSTSFLGDQTPIEVVAQTDSICAPCPNRRDSKCTSEKKIGMLDEAHAKVLEITEGDILTWGDAKTRIAQKMSIEAFESACAPCSWKAMGVCEKALRDLKLKGGSP